MKLKYEIAIVGISILLVTAMLFRDRAPSFVRTFFTEATSTSWMLFDGRTRATAMANPLNSSTA